MDVYYKYPVTVAKITDDCIWIRYYRLGYGEFVEKPKFKRYFETFLNNRLPKIVGIYWNDLKVGDDIGKILMGCDTFHSEIPMVRGKPVIIKRLYNDKVLVEFTMGLGGRGICHTTITK